MQTATEQINKKVLIVDDDDVFRTRLCKSFEKRGFSVSNACNAVEAMLRVKEFEPAYVVSDLKMPGESGFNLLEKIIAYNSNIKVLMLTGYGSIATAVESVKAGAVHYLTKPADIDDIIACFENKTSEISTAPARKTKVPSLSEVEWEHLQRVMNECGGNITKAAKMLGMHRRSLQRKLAK